MRVKQQHIQRHHSADSIRVSPRRLRQELQSWVRRLRPRLMLTFNFGYPIDPITASRRMTDFFNRMHRIVLGKRWNHCPPGDRLTAIGCLEHPDTNPHFHVLVAGNERLLLAMMTEGSGIWLKSVPRGQLHVAVAKSRKQVTSYATKRLGTLSAFDGLFAYTPGAAVRNRGGDGGNR